MMRKNSKMVSINTCIMIDFTGQVASESIGIEQYSGTGGQSDTAVGATEGFDGKGSPLLLAVLRQNGDHFHHCACATGRNRSYSAPQQHRLRGY